jgi:hypothetical protein
MSFNIKTGGGWNEIVSGWVKVAGTWQQVQSAWVKVAGTWLEVFTNKSVSLPGDTSVWHNFSGVDNPTYAGMQFTAASRYNSYDSDGSVTDRGAYATGYNPTTELWIRCTHNSGTAPSGSTLGTWLQISTTRGWYISDSNGSASAVNSNWTIDIATDSGGSTIVATQTYTPQANYSTA